ncbi:major facilitator superfamily domain-containing protein [Armillaria mellea]|nr:major facilitator superfamily domain-containing protein [Armillaria mellea]
MFSVSQDMQCDVVGHEAGNEFAVAFNGRASLLQSQSSNVSMIHIDEGKSAEEAHGDVFGGPLQTPINGEFDPDQIATAHLQNASSTPTNDECIFIGRLLEVTLRNIEDRGIGLAAHLGRIEQKMEDLQNGVSDGLQDICNDIRDTVGLVQLDTCQIQQIRQMRTNRYTTGHSNSQALENLKSTIRSKGTVSAISPLLSNEEVVDHLGPEVPETVTVTQKQARMGTAGATTKKKGKTARKIMERSKERPVDEENAVEPGRYSEAAATKKINGGKAVKTRSRAARAAGPVLRTTLGLNYKTCGSELFPKAVHQALEHRFSLDHAPENMSWRLFLMPVENYLTSEFYGGFGSSRRKEVAATIAGGQGHIARTFTALPVEQKIHRLLFTVFLGSLMSMELTLTINHHIAVPVVVDVTAHAIRISLDTKLFYTGVPKPGRRAFSKYLGKGGHHKTIYSMYLCPCTILSDASVASWPLGIVSHDPAVGHMSGRDRDDSKVSGSEESYHSMELDVVSAKRVWFKLDFYLLPAIAMFYFLSFLDRTNIGNARIAGLQRDLNMTNKQYSIALTVTYVIGPNYMLPTLLTIWGVVTTLQGVVTSYGGLLTCQFFLGLFEGGVFPGLVLYLTHFYPRAKMTTQAFSEILAYGIIRMDGVGGRAGWRWIFILEGAFTVAWGLMSYFLLPRDAMAVKFLRPAEREYVASQVAESGGEKFEWREVRKAFVAPHVWILGVVFFFSGAVLFGLAFAGGILSTWLMGSLSTAPKYVLGTRVMVAFSAGMAVGSALCLGYFIMMNRKKRKMQGQVIKGMDGDLAPSFVYLL